MRNLLTIFLLFAAAPAFAAESITLALPPSEVAALQRALDRQPMSQIPPPGFWPLQMKINHALAADPVAKRAFQSAFESTGKHGR